MSQRIGVIESCKNYYFISLEGSDCGSEMHTERFFKKIYFLQKRFQGPVLPRRPLQAERVVLCL